MPLATALNASQPHAARQLPHRHFSRKFAQVHLNALRRQFVSMLDSAHGRRSSPGLSAGCAGCWGGLPFFQGSSGLTSVPAAGDDLRDRHERSPQAVNLHNVNNTLLPSRSLAGDSKRQITDVSRQLA